MKNTTPPTYEEFLDDPHCRECNESMELIDGCEWPEDPELWRCAGCVSLLASRLLGQNAALQKFADLAKLESIKLRNGLLEAKAGLEFAIRATQGQGNDWSLSTPRVALKCVHEALGMNPQQ